MNDGSSSASETPSGAPGDIRKGRSAPFVMTPEWVVLAEISPQAKALFVALQAHANQKRGDGLVWPSTDTVARILGYSRRQSLQPLLRALVGIGAVEVTTEAHRAGRRNVYLVHETPPDGYAGFVSLAAFYADRKAQQMGDGTVDRPMGGTVQRPTGRTVERPITIRTEPYEVEPEVLTDQPLVDIARATVSEAETANESPSDHQHPIRLAHIDRHHKAQHLVGVFVRALEATGFELDDEARGEFGTHIRDLVRSGASDDELRATTRAHIATETAARRDPAMMHQRWINARFGEFWAAYPRKADWGRAAKAWSRIVNAGTHPDTLTEAARAYTWKSDVPGCELPYPHTWLNTGEWRRWVRGVAEAA